MLLKYVDNKKIEAGFGDDDHNSKNQKGVDYFEQEKQFYEEISDKL